MNRISIIALLLLLCATMCMNSCSGKDGKINDTSTTDAVTTEAVTTDAPDNPPIIDIVVNKELLEPNFYGLEGKTYGDTSFSFIEDGLTTVLKQERVTFADGKKWDAATNAWVTASDVTTSERMYTFAFKETFTSGNLEVKFRFKREGGAKQSFCIKPSGVVKSQAGIVLKNDTLYIGNPDTISDAHTKVVGGLTSTDVKKVELSDGEWYNMRISYGYETHTGLTVSVVVTDEYGNMVASIVRLLGRNFKINNGITGIDIIDSATENLADYGEAAPENTTSVWYIKNMTAKANPMETGDRIKLKPTTIETAKGVQSYFLTVDGYQTIRTYFGQYSLLPDNSGFIIGTGDRSFYLYEFATQELVYLDKTYYSPTSDKGDGNSIQQRYYVNPITGNVFYSQLNENNYPVLYKINPKTYEKTLMYESTNANMNIYVEVTNDEKYVAFMIGGYQNAGVTSYFGRINLETDTVEYQHPITYNKRYCVNHLVINPEYPDLLFFHREQLGDSTVTDCSNIMNFVTGEIITYDHKGYSGHAIWTIDGEYVQLQTGTGSGSGSAFGLLDKNLKEYVIHANGIATHPMADRSLTWYGCDSGANVWFGKVDGSQGTYLSRNPSLYLPHPYQPHTEVSQDGSLIMWGYCDENGVLGIAWTNNPFLK